MHELLKNKITLESTFDFNQLVELMDKGVYKTTYTTEIPCHSDYVLENNFKLIHPEKTYFFNNLLKKMDEQFNTENKKSNLTLFFSFKASVGPSHIDKEDVNILGLYGKTLYIVDNQHYCVEKGDVLKIKRGTLHKSIALEPRIILSHGIYY
jgi:quercetin dioxygenase-like cupin family protein